MLWVEVPNSMISLKIYQLNRSVGLFSLGGGANTSVERFVELGLEKIVECQKKIGLNPTTPAEMKFLQSFLSVMKPIITAMKLLEKESDTYIR